VFSAVASVSIKMKKPDDAAIRGDAEAPVYPREADGSGWRTRS
jgi:hypothetical protein